MNYLDEATEGEATSGFDFNDLLAAFKTLMRFILPLIGLGYFVKYFEDETTTE